LQSWADVAGENYPLAVPTKVGNVQAYDSDLGDQDGLTSGGAPVADATIEASVAAIHATGAHAICYMDAGTAEDWRSDYGKFDPSELGGPDQGWPGEEFIDVADWSTPVPSGYETLETIMTDRMKLCQEEGFDAIDADNVDAYSDGDIGVNITMGQEETYIDELVAIAHSDGLAFFLVNEINGDSLLATEAPLVDGEIVEQCWADQDCSALDVFVQEGKPILDIEYAGQPEATLCGEANAFPMTAIQTDLALDGDISYGCWEYGGGPTTTVGSTTTTGRSTTTTGRSTTTTGRSTTTTGRSTTTTTARTTTTTKPPVRHRHSGATTAVPTATITTTTTGEPWRHWHRVVARF
jgi:hypothetical protein